jgi:hypothetical protein
VVYRKSEACFVVVPALSQRNVRTRQITPSQSKMKMSTWFNKASGSESFSTLAMWSGAARCR